MENLDPPEEMYQAQTKPFPRNQKKASNHGLQEHQVTPATSKTNSYYTLQNWCSMLSISVEAFFHMPRFQDGKNTMSTRMSQEVSK